MSRVSRVPTRTADPLPTDADPDIFAAVAHHPTVVHAARGFDVNP